MQIPAKNCPICPRLCKFRQENKTRLRGYWNAPVPAFGGEDAQLLIVGLGPGLHGANQTGRPFTGDYAGFTLYEALQKYDFAKGNYYATLPESLDHRMKAAGGINGQGEFHLLNCRVSNAVRCVPPENKPEPEEIRNCNQFLKSEIWEMPNLKAILSLGLVSHNAVLRALGQKASAHKFAHGAEHTLVSGGGWRKPGSDAPHMPMRTFHLFDSYHCSRYNINTGRLNQAMFDAVIEKIRNYL